MKYVVSRVVAGKEIPVEQVTPYSHKFKNLSTAKISARLRYYDESYDNILLQKIRIREFETGQVVFECGKHGDIL